jgi:hypothetical protein
MQMYIHSSVLLQTEMEITKNKNSYTVKKVDRKLCQPDQKMQYSSILPFSLYKEVKNSNISSDCCPCKCTFMLLLCCKQRWKSQRIKKKNSYTVKKVDGKLRQPDRMMQYSSVLPFSLNREVKYSNIVLIVYANVHSYFCFAANRDGNHKE